VWGRLGMTPAGNMTTVGGETHTYDVADRHLSTVKGSTTVSYARDVTDRIIQRVASGETTVRYNYSGSGDAADFVTTTAEGLVEASYTLPGGVLLTWRTGSGSVWSYPNIGGTVAAVANQSGVKQGGTFGYDPDGNTLGTPVDIAAGKFDYGWHGEAQRPVETAAGLLPMIEMGARQYLPRLGRFIEVDPVEGGSCNDYDYVCAGPINKSDLDGMFLGWIKEQYKKHRAAIRKAVGALGTFVAVGGLVACAVAAAGVCGVATLIGVGFSAVKNLGRCLVRRCSGRQWLKAGINTAVDSGLSKLGGNGVRASVGAALKGCVPRSLGRAVVERSASWTTLGAAARYCKNCWSVAHSAGARGAARTGAAHVGGWFNQ
jgi:RHS repeat-associated protein